MVVSIKTFGMSLTDFWLPWKSKCTVHTRQSTVLLHAGKYTNFILCWSQALLLWEGLLMVEAKADPDLIALVRDFVECRMVNIWGAGAVSNKVILQTKNDDGSSRDDFIMLRCSKQQIPYM